MRTIIKGTSWGRRVFAAFLTVVVGMAGVMVPATPVMASGGIPVPGLPAWFSPAPPGLISPHAPVPTACGGMSSSAVVYHGYGTRVRRSQTVRIGLRPVAGPVGAIYAFQVGRARAIQAETTDWLVGADRAIVATAYASYRFRGVRRHSCPSLSLINLAAGQRVRITKAEVAQYSDQRTYRVTVRGSWPAGAQVRMRFANGGLIAATAAGSTGYTFPPLNLPNGPGKFRFEVLSPDRRYMAVGPFETEGSLSKFPPV